MLLNYLQEKLHANLPQGGSELAVFPCKHWIKKSLWNSFILQILRHQYIHIFASGINKYQETKVYKVCILWEVKWLAKASKKCMKIWNHKTLSKSHNLDPQCSYLAKTNQAHYAAEIYSTRWETTPVFFQNFDDVLFPHFMHRFEKTEAAIDQNM